MLEVADAPNIPTPTTETLLGVIKPYFGILEQARVTTADEVTLLLQNPRMYSARIAQLHSVVRSIEKSRATEVD